MKSILSIVICTMMTSVGASNQETNKNDLQQIMNELMSNAQTLSQAILLQDFEQIEKAAGNIANHPKPSIQTLKTVKQNLAKQMASFKQHDNTVHQAAIKIVSFAQSKEIQQVTTEYLRMYQGCQSCHVEFKQRISAALKEK